MAKDDDEREDDEREDGDADPESTEDDADDDGDEWTPPTKEEFERMQRTLVKRNREKRELRRKIRESSSNSTPAATADDKGPDVESIRREIQSSSDQRVIRSELKNALRSAGLVDTSPDAIKRAVRLVDLEDIAVDDDGEVDGLEDAIASLRASMPSLFRKTRERPKGTVQTGSRGSSGGTGSGKAAKSSASRLAESLRKS